MNDSYSHLSEQASLLEDSEFRKVLDCLPVAAYTCDKEGLITHFNAHAEELWGRAPKLNSPDDRFCGSFELFSSDGNPVQPANCWMAHCLAQGTALDSQEVVVKRPNGDKRTVMAHISTIHDKAGSVVGAVNVMIDVTRERQVDAILHEAIQVTSPAIGQDFF